MTHSQRDNSGTRKGELRDGSRIEDGEVHKRGDEMGATTSRASGTLAEESSEARLALASMKLQRDQARDLVVDVLDAFDGFRFDRGMRVVHLASRYISAWRAEALDNDAEAVELQEAAMGATTTEKSGTPDHYIEQMAKLAEVGAALCCYMPGAGNPELWSETRCDCKRLPDLFSVLRQEYIALGDFTSEMTGCVEVRTAWRAMDTLREQAEAIPRAADA